MTGKELRAIRRVLGLSTRQMGYALAYTGPNVAGMVRSLECEQKPIQPDRARLALMFLWCGVPPDWTDAEK
jgi:hypothetical protein